VPVPAIGPRTLLGRDLADALLFTGQRVVPRALEASSYRFAHPTLDVALRHLLGK
jgi:NAD dependent epimerase/dehydratase family enzyme